MSRIVFRALLFIALTGICEAGGVKPYGVHTYSDDVQLNHGGRAKFAVHYGGDLDVVSIFINSTIEKGCSSNFTKISLIGHTGTTTGYCNTQGTYSCLILSSDFNLHRSISLGRDSSFTLNHAAGCAIVIHHVEVVYIADNSFSVLLIVIISVAAASVLASAFCCYRRRKSKNMELAHRNLDVF